jgi:flotillin
MDTLTDFLSKFGVPIVVIGIAIAILGVIRLVVRNYKKVSPNEALVISGKGTTTNEGRVGFRVVQGGATFVWPVFEKAEIMRLGLMKIGVRIENAPNKDGVPVTIEAIGNVKISNQQTMLMAAVERFLGMEPDEIMEIIKGVLEGTLRQMIGTLTLEEIIQNREALSKRVVEINGEELAKIGVVCDNFVISDVKDNKGYINAMGTKRTAEVQRDATIAAAEADREAKIKSSDAKREADKTTITNEQQVAEAQRTLSLKKAEYLKETAAADAEAALAGEIAKTARQQDLEVQQANVARVRAEQATIVAEKEALLREKELIATTIKPAEAKREADKIGADGERQANTIRAEGAQRKLVIEASAAAETLMLTTNAQAEAVKIKANAEAEAAKAKADAEKARLTAEGEGKALAEAAALREKGQAEADAFRARQMATAETTQKLLEAEAAGARAKGEAEAAAIRAKLLAEAAGIDAKNKALAEMSPGARTVIILEKLPDVLDHGGEALAKVAKEMFGPIGHGLAAIDEIRIIDMGDGKQTGGVGKFAASIPAIVFEMMQKAKASGVDLDGMLAKVGIKFADFGKGLSAPAAESLKNDADKGDGAAAA